jgi:hypothetical protein
MIRIRRAKEVAPGLVGEADLSEKQVEKDGRVKDGKSSEGASA